MFKSIFAYSRQAFDRAAARAQVNDLASKVDNGQLSILEFTRQAQHVLDQRAFSWGVFWSLFFSTNRVAFVTYFVAVALMCLVPPWKSFVDARGASLSHPAGYALVVTPPKPRTQDTSVLVDSDRLRLQFYAATALLIAIIFLTDLVSAKLASVENELRPKSSGKGNAP